MSLKISIYTIKTCHTDLQELKHGNIHARPKMENFLLKITNFFPKFKIKILVLHTALEIKKNIINMLPQLLLFKVEQEKSTNNSKKQQ